MKESIVEIAQIGVQLTQKDIVTVAAYVLDCRIALVEFVFSLAVCTEILILLYEAI